jgi:hypothetical protein
MERDLDELSWLVSHENGKVLPEARGDVLKGIECLEFGLSLENMAQGEQLDVSRGINCSVTHEPLGVVAGVVPFNFPVMVPLWMLPQALAAGNTFVLKPSELVPYGALKLASLLQEAGLPDGVFNTVNGAQPAVEAPRRPPRRQGHGVRRLDAGRPPALRPRRRARQAHAVPRRRQEPPARRPRRRPRADRRDHRRRLRLRLRRPALHGRLD